MKVLLLNTFDAGGGAARSACRLNEGLHGAGVESRMLVQSKIGDSADVIGPRNRFEKLMGDFRLHLDAMPVRLYRNRPVINFAPALVPDAVTARVASLSPDIVHLHWVAGGFMRLESLRQFRRPLVWTLHDSWAFTGGCFLPFGCLRYRERCGACPVLGSDRDDDLSRRIWERKSRAWQGLPLTVVAPSRWLADCARASSLFAATRVEVIPNGLDLALYRPVERLLARDLLGLPSEGKLILFGAVRSSSNLNKGFDLLNSALQHLAAHGWGERCRLLVFGAAESSTSPDFGMQATYLGQIDDEARLALLYAAADVCVVPSRQENLSNVVMESLACGTPCVAFDIGGMPDMIEHQRNGYLARPYETDDLARGIAWVLEDGERWQTLSARARQKVENEFDIRLVARRYAELYEKLLAC